jgi:hypothetical protein
MDKAKKSIIDCLIFKESFDDLLTELSSFMNEKMLTALMRELIEDGYVQSFAEKEDGRFTESFGHDADDMRGYVYQATAKGINILQ